MNENRRKLYILTANSTIFYILAYLAIHIPSQILTHFVARGFDIPTKFNYLKLVFPIPDHSQLWSANSVSAIYAATPVFALVLAIFIARYYVLHSSKKGINTNLFLIWTFAHCINIFFGGLAIGIPLIKGFGYVPNWLYASDELTFVFLVVSLLILFGNGFILKSPFTALYYNQKYFNSPFHSFVFKVFIVFIPFFAANLLFLLFNFPDSSAYERLVGITMFIQLIGILPYSPTYTPEEQGIKNVSFSKKGLLMLIAVLFSLLLWIGIHNRFIYKAPSKAVSITEMQKLS